jgi:hypothetical protein
MTASVYIVFSHKPYPYGYNGVGAGSLCRLHLQKRKGNQC